MRQSPWVLIVPLICLGVMIGVGEFAVLYANSNYRSDAQSQAASAVTNAAAQVSQQLIAIAAPNVCACG